MPTPNNVIFFTTPAELRAWFEANHETAPELWVGYHKKKTGRPSITWQDLVDQELCFGWIDSVRYSLGDDTSAQRVTPRRKGSIWSAVNIRRFHELEKLCLVQAAGRAAFAKRDEARSRIYSYENRQSAVLDPDRAAAFRKRAKAWKFFVAQAPWYRSTAVFWVMSAKRDETRDRRLSQLIDCSQRAVRIPPLSRP
ncbi:MAG TPA: YdeI/OmpD-associated family protein [Candidatus Dormibacteraeota bacterium]|nr:YdeI/OmpD-associated family protein [Candidatus Dormibacteraeota bacterium]